MLGWSILEGIGAALVAATLFVGASCSSAPEEVDRSGAEASAETAPTDQTSSDSGPLGTGVEVSTTTLAPCTQGKPLY